MSQVRTSKFRTVKEVSYRRAVVQQVKRRVASARKPSRRRARMAPELKGLMWLASAAMLLVGVMLYPFQPLRRSSVVRSSRG
jgi:hypothetical protein